MRRIPRHRSSPCFDLASAQRQELQISKSCVQRADELLMAEDERAVRRHIRALFRSLTAEDFAHCELMPQRAGRALQGDVYGKLDEYGLWFIKFRIDGHTIVMSCHEAEHDITLSNGKILRRRQS